MHGGRSGNGVRCCPCWGNSANLHGSRSASCSTQRRVAFCAAAQQIHHAAAYQMSPALRKDSLLVKCGRDLPKAESSPLPQLCCAGGCGLFITHCIRRRCVAFWVRRCRLLCGAPDRGLPALKDRVKRARIPRSTTKGLPPLSEFRTSAAWAHRHRTVHGCAQCRAVLRIFDENAPTMGVCFLRVSPSVRSRAKLHSNCLEVVHSFARSLADCFPFPAERRTSAHSGPAFLLPSAYQSVTHRKQRPLFPFATDRSQGTSQVLDRARQSIEFDDDKQRQPFPHKASTAHGEVG